MKALILIPIDWGEAFNGLMRSAGIELNLAQISRADMAVFYILGEPQITYLSQGL